MNIPEYHNPRDTKENEAGPVMVISSLLFWLFAGWCAWMVVGNIAIRIIK